MSADVRESKRPAVIDRRYNAIFSHLRSLSAKQAAEPGEMSALKIDFSDGPELTPEMFARAIVRRAAI